MLAWEGLARDQDSVKARISSIEARIDDQDESTETTKEISIELDAQIHKAEAKLLRLG